MPLDVLGSFDGENDERCGENCLQLSKTDDGAGAVATAAANGLVFRYMGM